MKSTLTGHGARSTVHDAVLEIGSEELPASFIGMGMTQLKVVAESSLKENGLPYTSIHVYGTPRRLAVVIAGLPDRSPDQEKVIAGPPAAKGKDASGQWTQAAIGFAAKNGLRPEDLTVQQERLCAALKIKGVPTRQLLAQLFPTWIRSLQFPKTMVWEPTQQRYPRPIRWIAALFGSDAVSFKLAGVSSGRWTLGLGPWAPRKIPITHAGKYALLLKNQCVLVDPEIRKDTIRRFADQAVKRVHGKLHLSSALLDQVANLVEHPVAIVGNFDPAYLDLPKEVLITCLEHHQKYFPVEQLSSAKLLPHFIGIRNGMSVHQEIVREGYERVLAARLADARFFYNQDRKNSFSSKVEALKGVTFQQKLGNLFDKKERVKRLAESMMESLGSPAWKEQTLRIIELGKADLVTDMVREFPELQGVMARIYAQADGENEEVAQGLEQHYWPITLTSPLPKSDAAAMAALADKLDTLAGDFAVGLIPSGSADPYGLRRAAVGVLRILEDRKWPLSLHELIRQALEHQPEAVRAKAREMFEKLKTFMQQRLAALLEERGYKVDEIDAVLSVYFNDMNDLLDRVKALHEIHTSKEFIGLAEAYKRAMNITRQAAKIAVVSHNVQPDLLKEPSEQKLSEALQAAKVQVEKDLHGRAYKPALESLLSLRQPLDSFFKDVMVNAEDQALRANRLALMMQVVRMFSAFADFSKLQHG